MNMTIVADPQAFEEALSHARALGANGQLRGLAAPLDGALLGKVNSAWEIIESWLRKAYAAGQGRAVEFMQAASAEIESVLQAAGGQINEVRTFLLRKLQDYVNMFVKNMMTLVPVQVMAGTQALPIRSVHLSHKVSLGGKLEGSLLKVFELTSEGEMTIAVEYGLLS